MAEALEQARVGRLQILAAMQQTIADPRPELSPFAPRMITVKIDPDKIGAVIGKGGANIRGLEEEFAVSVDIQEDGTVFVAGVDGKLAELAAKRIQDMTREPEIGEIFSGKVVRITDFGAFVEFIPGIDGMVHISQISPDHLRKVEDALQLGDEVMVMIVDKSPEGKYRLSRKAVLEGWTLEQARADDRPKPSGGSGGRGRSGDRGNGRGGDRGDRGGRGGQRRR
jgi:polyribonucleotide nucleotidyltransferase